MKRDSLLFMLNVDSEYRPHVMWVLEVFGQYTNTEIKFVEKKTEGVCSFGFSNSDTFMLSRGFWQNMDLEMYSWSHNLKSDLSIHNELSKIDYLATAFYFINCIWERDKDQELDGWGRNQFKDSVWKMNGYDRPFTHVNQIFNLLCDQLGINRPSRKSKLFLSHDIDAVYSGWKEDGFSDLKRKKIKNILVLSLQALIGRHNWMNFDIISKIEEKYDFRSTYYWINYSNKVKNVGRNADYLLTNKKIASEILKLSKRGNQHGLHKSINSFSIKYEVEDFPFEIQSNRYHYLKFTFEHLIQEMDKTNLELDASLGYAEVIGFRNGYSLPFKPFDLKNRRATNFIEVPLVIMDATLSRYQKMKSDAAIHYIQNFIEENSENSIISILWHNSHFSNIKYEGYADVYESILKYSRSIKLNSVQPDYLIENYLK